MVNALNFTSIKEKLDKSDSTSPYLLVNIHPKCGALSNEGIQNVSLAGVTKEKHHLQNITDYLTELPPEENVTIFIEGRHPITFEQIHAERESIKKLYQRQIVKNKIILLHFIEHPYLINSSILYPQLLVKDLIRDTRGALRKSIPSCKKEWIEALPLTVKFSGQAKEDIKNWDTQINKGFNAKEFENIYQICTTCLYPPDQYRKIKIDKILRKNVVSVQAESRNGFKPNREIIKIDSVSKINNEYIGYDSIRMNSTSGYFYRLLQRTEFSSEFIAMKKY